ncbi:MAG: ABC transporter ATP-binding protein [Chloroflexi bacterium]|nr:ABC transporter ATP-binding protein [Chloroflexota bacterium]
MPIIKTEHLTKKFKDLVAVNDVSLEVEDGECFGLLGVNGAGKTSLIRMLTAVSPPTEGKIWVLGKDLEKHSREIKAALGVVPQVNNLDPDLTVLQNLMTFARYFAIPRDEARKRSMELLKAFELESKLRSRIDELSGGMKRRLLIARGLLNMPRILILDEPTVGLDPQAKYMMWNKLTEQKSGGVTLILCTQNMEEAATLCDRVAIMHQGRVITLDAPRTLVQKYIGKEIFEIEVEPAKREEMVGELKKRGLEFEALLGRIHVFHIEPDGAKGPLRDLPGTIRSRAASLEDVFLRLTGRSLVE